MSKFDRLVCGDEFLSLDGLADLVAELMRELLMRPRCMTAISIGHAGSDVYLTSFGDDHTRITASFTDISIVGRDGRFMSVIPLGSSYRIQGNPGISDEDMVRAGTIKIEFRGPSGTKLMIASELRT